MKTLKVVLAISAIVLMGSCGAYYRMTTTIDRNGKTHREIYANGNKEFLSGNMTENPFLFEVDSSWIISYLMITDIKIADIDSVVKQNFFGDEQKVNVKISKSVNNIENYSQEMCYDKENESLAAPEELLVKKSGGFIQNISLLQHIINYNTQRQFLLMIILIKKNKYFGHKAGWRSTKFTMDRE
jgi:hypothetical protein